MKYSSFQKKFIVYICKYHSDIQGYLFKDILQDFLKKKNKYGLEVNEKNVNILIDKNRNSNEVDINKYVSEIYSIVYLLYELEKKELIYLSDTIINGDFKYSITDFNDDFNININIKENKSKFFLEIINSQIYISNDLRKYIFLKKFLFNFESFVFWIGILVSIASIISTIYDVLTYHFKG